jgi:hypothetical protein
VEEDSMGRTCTTLGGEVCTVSWWENLKQINHKEDQGVYERIILKIILEKYDGGMWTGLIWLRIETSGRPLTCWASLDRLSSFALLKMDFTSMK